MTEKADKYSAEVYVSENFDTGKKGIYVRVLKNRRLETCYVLDSLAVYEKTSMSTTWNALEKEND